jgi:oxygen tolerance protein BatD
MAGKRISILFLLLPLYLSSYSQVLAKATVDKNQILIGEKIQLSFDVRIPLGKTIQWFTLDTLPRFQILDLGKVDTTESVDGKKIVQTLIITSFDSGHIQIPPLAIKVDKKAYYTDSIGVDVSYVPFNPDEDYREISDIIEVKKPASSNLIWFILATVILLGIGVFYFLYNRRKQVATVSEKSRLNPYEEAMQALEELRKQGTPADGMVKNYYTKLNDILRIYIMRKLGIGTLEKTNDELVLQLQKIGLPRDQFTQLSEALRLADFVKFAKYTPGATDMQSSFQTIKSSIEILNKQEEKTITT